MGRSVLATPFCRLSTAGNVLRAEGTHIPAYSATSGPLASAPSTAAAAVSPDQEAPPVQRRAHVGVGQDLVQEPQKQAPYRTCAANSV